VPRRERDDQIAMVGGTPNLEAFSIIRPAPDDGGEATEYARAVLSGDSQLVDWRDDAQRKRFLNERQHIAETIG
jgi:hypothetical protein